MRTTLLLFFFLFFFTTHFAHGQSRIPGFALQNRVGVQVDEPTDVAVDSENNIYFVSGTVKKFRYHEFLGTEYLDFAPEGLNMENYGTYDIALDQHDNLYAVSYTYSRVAKFSKEGKLLLEFGTAGEGPGQFKFPEGIAVNSKDEIYVADTGNRRIQKFDRTGQLLQVIPLDPTTGNYFEAPLSLDFDGDNNLYLLHNPENKIVKYSPAGERLLEFGHAIGDTALMMNPWKLAVDRRNNQVYVTDLDLAGFYRFNLEGGLESIMSHKRSSHLYGTMMSIAIGAYNESIFIADRRDNHESQLLIFNGMGGEGSYAWGNLWQNQDLTLDGEGNVYLLDEIGRITKFNGWGEFVMTFGDVGMWRANHPNIIIKYPKAITSDLFNNLYVLRSPGIPGDTTVIYKLDQNGKAVRIYHDLLPSTNTYTDLTVDATGNMYIADLTAGQIHKIGTDGRHLGTIGSPGFGLGELWMPVALAIDNTGILHVLDYNGGRVQQFDAKGDFIRQFGKFSKNDGSSIFKSDLVLDGKGNIHVASNLAQRRYWVFNSKGDLIHEVLDSKVNRISVDKLGINLVLDDNQADGYSHYVVNEYETPQSVIKGVVYDDANNNCVHDEEERTLSGIVVATNPGPYYAITDKNGAYTLTITPAEYALHTMLPQQMGRTITATCPLPEKGHRITVTDPGQLIHLNFGNHVHAPAHLSVSVNSTRRRRCFESTTIVKYSNTGFSNAPDAKVYLQLPLELALLSADKPYSRLDNGTYVFSVGTIEGGKSGTITIQDIVTCGDESVRGRTVCTRAWITPSNNKPSSPVATVTITGQCNYDLGMVRFVLKNTGTADMETAELFRKYIDGDLASIEQYRLAAGDSIVLWVPTSGMTVRLEADQPDGNGDNTKASVTVEACRASATQSGFSTGFVSALPTDDEEAEVSEECMLITDSYDPNDKLVTPVGRTEEHYTPTGTALKYKIRFQNTGTDVAYRVVVVDTLSEYLDLTTIQVGATSHPSRFEVSGKGLPVLTWTFDNIMLPDSTADEPGSHGYIQFSIKPKADLPEKTAVKNFADIFFDFNSPIRTNITVNRIYDMPPVINEAVRINLEDVLATPAITKFSPAAGKIGAEVTITGKRFSTNVAGNKVYLNGKAATVISATETELRIVVPIGSATGNLKVVTPDGGVMTTESFVVYQPPVLTSFSPVEGMAGHTVIISGEHLQADLIDRIKLNGLVCEMLSTTATSLTVRVPAGAETGRFELHTKGGEALSATDFVVWHQPIISSLSTDNAIVGATLRINGAHFASDKARNKVKFGQTLATILESTQHQLSVKVPTGAESGQISLETPGGMAWSVATFEVIPGPIFTAMQPAKGTVGTVVEITGEHFGIQGQQDVIRFNGEPALIIETSENRYKVRVPRGARTGRVTVSGYGGEAPSTEDFVVEELAPTDAIQVYPNPNNGQFTVNLRHADFDVQTIEVHDAVGKRLHQTLITGPRPETVEINLPYAKSGLYFLQLQTGRGLIIKKLHVL